MNLKNKISLIVSLLFTLIFGISVTVIYLLFADFRKDEFRNRLKEKALLSIKLLVEVEQIDRQLLKIIDQNSIHKLYDEKVLIFDAGYQLIYSSLDDTKINWSIDDLKYLKKNGAFFKKQDHREVYGFFYDTNDHDYYALISASDNLGNRKLDFLFYTLLISYIIFTFICWLSTSYIVQKLLLPLHLFHTKLKGINENNLDTRIDVKEVQDEIDLLAHEFNQMLHRIDVSYQKQKEFTSHASHELRTPIARISARIENKIIDKSTDTGTRSFLQSLLLDINQLAELIASLLLLSKLENKKAAAPEVCRVDELIYETSEKINALYPYFKLQLYIGETENDEDFLEIKGNKSLLEIAFANLLKNACLYSANHTAEVQIIPHARLLEISITNTGTTLLPDEQQQLFTPFMRGQNSGGKSGLGLGLRIVQRILMQHNAEISYSITSDGKNTFTIIFLI